MQTLLSIWMRTWDLSLALVDGEKSERDEDTVKREKRKEPVANRQVFSIKLHPTASIQPKDLRAKKP